MTKLHGKHLIGGTWSDGASRFMSARVHGQGHSVSEGDAHSVARAAEAAEEAFWSYAATRAEIRADLLNAMADQIESRGDEITEIAAAETGLPEARLEGERGRTCGQLRLFAAHILEGDYLDKRHDPALPDRKPLPRPDLRLEQRPVGPVAVFGASNFPLAFSTAGGDTAAALAAGCPVVVKGHPAHPGTSEIVAEAVRRAIEAAGVHPGVFNLIQSSGIEAGTALVQHPLISAVGFTGSLGAGRALFDLCAARPVPIPFFGELGSVNPVFVLPEAARTRAAEIAKAWAGSLTMGAGQFCTNPGVVFIHDGTEAGHFVAEAKAALASVAAQHMLTRGIADAYHAGCNRLSQHPALTTEMSPTDGTDTATPAFFSTTGADWLANADLGHEVFGPSGLLIRVKDDSEMLQIAKSLEGQLTCTLQMDPADAKQARTLLPILERKAGRILANGFPTGVEVAGAMVHGGPYPASTNFGATSVGTLAIRRFLRPVCYQDIPDEVMPAV
jgi:NADP-dependent aldehyde dehydrogenase